MSPKVVDLVSAACDRLNELDELVPISGEYLINYSLVNVGRPCVKIFCPCGRPGPKLWPTVEIIYRFSNKKKDLVIFEVFFMSFETPDTLIKIKLE